MHKQITKHACVIYTCKPFLQRCWRSKTQRLFHPEMCPCDHADTSGHSSFYTIVSIGNRHCILTPYPISLPPVHSRSTPVQNVASVAKYRHVWPISRGVPIRFICCWVYTYCVFIQSYSITRRDKNYNSLPFVKSFFILTNIANKIYVKSLFLWFRIP